MKFVSKWLARFVLSSLWDGVFFIFIFLLTFSWDLSSSSSLCARLLAINRSFSSWATICWRSSRFSLCRNKKNWSRDSNVEHSLDGNLFVRDPSLSVCGYEICRLIQAFAIRQTRLYFAWKRATSFYVKGKDCRQVRRRHVVTSSVLAKDNSIQFCLFWSLKRAGDWRCEREERALCESKCNPRGWATSIKPNNRLRGWNYATTWKLIFYNVVYQLTCSLDLVVHSPFDCPLSVQTTI